jgi:hypothetical protein
MSPLCPAMADGQIEPFTSYSLCKVMVSALVRPYDVVINLYKQNLQAPSSAADFQRMLHLTIIKSITYW